MRLPDPPLTPGADEAQDLVRRELVRPEYHEDNLFLRLVSWLSRVLEDGVTSAREAPPLTTFAAMLVGLLLVGAVAWLVSRTRRSTHAPGGRALLVGAAVTADELRARAEAAFGEERYADALVDAYRAAALRQIERGRADDVPGATAHEVAVALGEVFPEQATDLQRCAGLFDLVLYGGRPATREQARDVLGLDGRLGARR